MSSPKSKKAAKPQEATPAATKPEATKPEATKPQKATPQDPFSSRAVVAALVAWTVPGAGHVFLKRPGRGLVFLALVVLALVLGCSLEGRLPWYWSGSPLRVLSTLGSMGSGAAFFLLRYGLGYEGDIEAPGFEYGSAFIVTAGLMNLLLVLDAFDIALGRKD